MTFRSFLLLSCTLSLGCEEAPKPVADKPAKQDAPDAPAINAAPAAEVSVKITGWDETLKLVAEQRGKVVVLDLWSSSCLPCVQEFPNLVAMHKRFEGKVACISFNLDYTGDPKEPPETLREPVLKFLRQKGASFTNVLSSDPDTSVYEKLDLAAIPSVVVYGRDGKLVKRFDNDKEEFGKEGYTYKDHVVPFVEKLLHGD